MSSPWTHILHVKSSLLQKLHTSELYTGKPNNQIFYSFEKNIADELNHDERNKYILKYTRITISIMQQPHRIY